MLLKRTIVLDTHTAKNVIIIFIFTLLKSREVLNKFCLSIKIFKKKDFIELAHVVPICLSDLQHPKIIKMNLNIYIVYTIGN